MTPVDLLISGGIVVTLDPRRRVIEDGAVVVRGDRIVGVGQVARAVEEVGMRGSGLPLERRWPIE